MDKDFFSSIDRRRDDYVKRAGVEEAIAEITFHTGRAIVLDHVVEASDGWLLLEGRDKLDESTTIALATPYHQIAAVQFVPRRERMGRTGF